MERLTTNKDVSEMNMVELAHNSCYVKDGFARYRDFENDYDARDLNGGHKYGNANLFGGMVQYKNKIAKIIKIDDEWYILDLDTDYLWSPEMLRPAEFKIWCNTEKEKQAVLEELEKEGYVWNGEEKPTEWDGVLETPMFFIVQNEKIVQGDYEVRYINTYASYTIITPSEFTGIDFSEKIVITKTSTGATATYGDKTVTTEGDFGDASRQALAEVFCPFRVGDRVRDKEKCIIGVVRTINSIGDVCVDFGTYDYAEYEKLELYKTPQYNAKLLCIDGNGRTFKQGYVYEVKDGIFHGATGIKFDNLEQINSHYCSKFMEIKGEIND